MNIVDIDQPTEKRTIIKITFRKAEPNESFCHFLVKTIREKRK